MSDQITYIQVFIFLPNTVSSSFLLKKDRQSYQGLNFCQTNANVLIFMWKLVVKACDKTIKHFLINHIPFRLFVPDTDTVNKSVPLTNKTRATTVSYML